jgi:trigger factor
MATVTATGANTVRVAVEVPATEVQAQAEKVYAELGRTVKVPGFRRGKVPRSLLEKRYAEYALREVVDELVPAAFERAAEELKLEPVNTPRYEVKGTPTLAGPLSFTADVAVFPNVKLPDYKTYVLKRETPKVGDEDVAKAVEELRHLNARLEPVEGRPAAAGELVIIKFLEAKPPEGFSSASVGIWAGEGEDAAFGRQVVGKAAGDNFALLISYPADYPAKRYAGKEVRAPAAVAEVKRRVLPAGDDDFAKELGEDSLATLRAKVQERLAARAEELSYVGAYRRLLDDVVAHAEVPLADAFVEEYVAGSAQEKELTEKQQTERRAAARQELTRYFVTRALARAEGITVSADEVREVIAQAASRPGAAPEHPADVYDYLLHAKLRQRLVPRGDAPPAP